MTRPLDPAARQTAQAIKALHGAGLPIVRIEIAADGGAVIHCAGAQDAVAAEIAVTSARIDEALRRAAAEGLPGRRRKA